MPVKVPYRKVGSVVILYPERRLTGLGAGPIKTITQELLDEGIRKFIISFKNVVSIDASYAAAINSVALNIKRYDGRVLLCDAGYDVLPWLEKNIPGITVYKDEELALGKFEVSPEAFKGNIAVVGMSDIARELYKGISRYKGLVFHFFDDPLKNIQKVIEIKPVGIFLNIEGGSIAVEPLRQWRFHPDLKEVPIIIFGPPSSISTARALAREGASDFIEVKFDGAEILAFLRSIDFRNILAKKLDMIIDKAYKDFDAKKYF